MPTTIRGDDHYLGDGYYAAYDGHHVRLYTSSDTVNVENAIYLAPAVLAVFLGWLQHRCPDQFAHLKPKSPEEPAAATSELSFPSSDIDNGESQR